MRISDKEAGQLGEGVSKLMNLTNLDLNFKWIFELIYIIIQNLFFLKKIKLLEKKFKRNQNLQFNRDNLIGTEGIAKLGKGVSKLVNLTSLNLNF